ncbi:glycosyltransferase [Kozakia baliensis]|uniref:glycosyltransferase n=1 Tax=Kozakia baliensis TaxID=153496 RepID=UPI000497DAA8|nr:glycosyltransferase [Kozakia baliensis]
MTQTFSVGIVLQDFALGGTERIAIRLANQWARSGVPVTIFAGTGQGPLRPLLAGNIRLILANPPIPRGPSSMRALAKAAARFWRRQPQSACFVPGNYHWPIASALARLPKATRPVIVTQISTCLNKAERGWLRQKLYNARMRYLLRGVDHLIALAPSEARQANNILGRPVSRTVPLPALADDTPPPVPVPPGHPTVLAAGRLVHDKGFGVLIESFAQVHRVMPEVRLQIAGSGPLRDELMAQVVANGLDHVVEFLGCVASIRPLLDACRCFVLSSRSEGFPAVILEAFAAGRQVISTSCTPATKMLLTKPEYGCEVPVGDAQALAQAIISALQRPPPSENELAACVQNYRIGPIAAEYLDLMRARYCDATP